MRTEIINSNLNSGDYVASNIEQLNLSINKNEQVSILIREVNKGSSLNIEVEENAILRISFLSSKDFNTFKFIANVHKNAQIEAYFADFSEEKNFANIEINLLEEGANCEWHLASLASKSDNKQFDVSVYHKARNTYAKMDNYGVCKDDAKLVFSGISEIIKNSHECKTHQNAKIMVFDEKSNAIAKPILKIDEHDIEASHAAIVGKINDEHLFYLTSRGLTEAEAKELITFGYLKPILNGFNDESIKEEINNLIEGRM